MNNCEVSMKQKILYVAVLIFTIFIATELFAEIKVISVSGTVAFKTGRNWTPLQKNQVIPEGTNICTGANSSAVLQMNQYNQKVEIKSLTVIKVFSKSDKTSSESNVALKRGKIQVNIPKNKEVKTIFKVSTPVATSSVRGTIEEIFYGPDKGMTVRVLEGEIEIISLIGKKALISDSLVYDQSFGDAKGIDVTSEMDDNAAVDTSSTEEESGEGTSGSDELIGNDNSWDNDLQIFQRQTDQPVEIKIVPDWP